MDKIKTVKIKNPDGSVSQETYTIAVDAKNVDMANDKDVQETIGNIDIDNDGNISQQLKNIKTILSLKANSSEIPKKVSELKNDNKYLVENNLEKMNENFYIENTPVSINNATGYSKIDNIYGKISQLLTPIPTSPETIDTVTGDICIEIDNGLVKKQYLIPLGTLELCGKNNDWDYLYKENGKWYINKVFGKKVLNGTEKWYRYGENLYIETLAGYKKSNNIPICTHYKGIQVTPGIIVPNQSNNNTIRFGGSQLSRLFIIDNNFSSANDFKNWLTLNNITLYYLLESPQKIPLTDEMLINSLNTIIELYNNENNIISIKSSKLIPKINFTYAITNRDFYSKEETNDRIILENKEDILKFHAIAKSSATYITQFPNGKNMLVDTGQVGQWTDIKNAIDELGITKFDYLILTHFHSDHIGNIQNICNTYDLSNCKCWVGMKPDFENHAEEIDESSASYDNIINLLKSNNLDPQVPEHDSFFAIDEGVTLHFLNTSSEIAENYYGRITEYRNERKLNFNHFSLITELNFHNKIITFTGDIEKVNEEYMNIYMRKANIITSPHHGVNIAAYKPFYENIKPEYSLNMYISNVNTWIHPFYKSFMYQKEFKTHMITPDCTEPINGLFSFDIKKSGIHFLNNGDSSIAPGREDPIIYTSFPQIYDRSNILSSEITLEQLFNAMEPCSIFQIYFWGSYQETYTTLYNEIKNLFPTFSTGKVCFFRDLNHYKELKVYNTMGTICQKAISNLATFNMIPTFSYGQLPDSILNTSNLIEILKKYPIGRYSVNYFQEKEDNTVLTSGGGYTLQINIINRDNSELYASIIATLRDVSSDSDTVCRVASGYINTTMSPYYRWIKLN